MPQLLVDGLGAFNVIRGGYLTFEYLEIIGKAQEITGT
jgi:hypothetical protein